MRNQTPPSRGSSPTTSKGPWRSRHSDGDVQRSTMLTTRRRRRPKVHDSTATTSKGPRHSRRSGLSSGPQARSSLKPLRRRWSTTATLPLWFRRTIPTTTTRISLCLLFVLQDLAFFFFFGCVRFGGFGLCFCEFFFFFFPLLVPLFGCSENVEKKIGIWILVRVLKNLLNLAMFSILLKLIWTLCFQIFR